MNKRLKKITGFVRSSIKNAKSGLDKINPLNKPVNKEDVSDTGIETIKLGNRGIKTVEKSVKTAYRTVKTTENTVRKTGTTIYRTAQITVKSTIAVSKFAVNAVVHTVAFLTSPLVIFLSAMIVIIIMVATLVVILLGGAVSASDSNQQAYSSAAGLGNVVEEYQNGIECLQNAIDDYREEFETMIDEIYYDYDEFTDSSLVYMERTDESGGRKIYETGFATDDYKNLLKSEWNITLTDNEFLAIAYVYLENQKNAEKHTEHGIYGVSYDEEVFRTILEKCILFSDTIYEEQKCPDENCTRHVEYVHNPDYDEAEDWAGETWDAYDEWCGIAAMISANDGEIDDKIEDYIDDWIAYYDVEPYYSNDGYDFLDYLYSRHEDAREILADTPEEIEEVTYICEYKHDLHSIGLAYFDFETVMDALEFDDISKQWVEMTIKGFEENTELS